MAENAVLVLHQQNKPIKVLKWKIREGSTVSIGRILLLYKFDEADNNVQHKLKCIKAGTVKRIMAPEGAIVTAGEPLYELKPCNHPTIMNDMCAECGADLRKETKVETVASVPMVHAIPDLKVSEEQAKIIGQADSERLLRDRKLVLLVDLDQTLIHTTNDNIPANLKDVYHFQLYGTHSPWYHTRLRPYTHTFLEHVCQLFELHICTFGTRNYAHTIAVFLDKDQKYFSNRILSRDECFDPTSKKANLKALFPCGDNLVCIIDDREDVWSNALNLIHVKPYHFFKHTGDINAPPGLDKQENDDVIGIDLSNITVKANGDKILKEVTDETKEVMDTKENKEQQVNGKQENEDAENKQNDEIQNKNTPNESVEPQNKENDVKNLNIDTNIKEGNENDVLDVEDPDNYLLYLETILKEIHKTFYEKYDAMDSGDVPDLKQIIPTVKSKVLKGVKLCFSGLVPTHVKLEQSKAYLIALSLGAQVSQDLEEDTTHLVAVRPGTAKVNSGKRRKDLKIVTADWLWCCAERWEHADERVFPLNSKGSKNRHPPAHCSSPEHVLEYPVHNSPTSRKRTPSGRFMDTINPLMSFSSADIADMDKEVEDILDDDSESSEDESATKDFKSDFLLHDENSSSSASGNEDFLNTDFPQAHKRTVDELYQKDENITELSVSQPEGRKLRKADSFGTTDEWESQDTENSMDALEETDDGEWNMMGEALEREFLSND